LTKKQLSEQFSTAGWNIFFFHFWRAKAVFNNPMLIPPEG
jgi:hypothetical protein